MKHRRPTAAHGGHSADGVRKRKMNPWRVTDAQLGDWGWSRHDGDRKREEMRGKSGKDTEQENKRKKKNFEPLIWNQTNLMVNRHFRISLAHSRRVWNCMPEKFILYIVLG